MSETHNFYTKNAEDFFSRTIDLDLTDIYAEFLPLIPNGGLILDAGCGSGRDSRYFLDQGYTVHAIDAAPELAEKATALIGQSVGIATFESFQTDRLFDGIWACASLLHVPLIELPNSINNLVSKLKLGGVFYMSFKYGRGERRRGKRLFTDMDEIGLEELRSLLSGLSLTKYWKTTDRRPDRKGETWMNALWTK